MKNCSFRARRPLVVVVVAGALAWVASAAGCAPKGPPPAQQPVGYYGPTEPLAEVVAQINANNAGIPSLWSRHYFEANVVDERGRSHFVNGDGVLLYRSPESLRLVGKKDIAGTIFELGSTPEHFWMTVVPELNTMWWGHHANVGRPCAQAIPIQPRAILEVLGVQPVPTNFLASPAPVLRFNNDADAYMVVWNVPGPDRWVAYKEVWYDRQTKRPRLVLLFDEDGRIVLRAYLTRHQPVTVEGVPVDRQPWVARDFDLFFPQTGTKMRLELTDARLENNGVPNERSIRFSEDAAVSRLIQIDENCTD